VQNAQLTAKKAFGWSAAGANRRAQCFQKLTPRLRMFPESKHFVHWQCNTLFAVRWFAIAFLPIGPFPVLGLSGRVGVWARKKAGCVLAKLHHLRIYSMLECAF
jgi:hypothetical protein